MTLSVSPKKRSLMASGKLRSALRGHGHGLSAIVQVGKAGVTPGLVKQLEQALADHELVKLKVAADSPGGRFAVADELGALPGVNVVQIVGGAILLYRRHPLEARYEGENAAKASLLKQQKAALDVADQRKTGEKSEWKPGDEPGAKAANRVGKRTGKRAGRKTGKRASKKSGRQTPVAAAGAASRDKRRSERPRGSENPRHQGPRRGPKSARRPEDARRSAARGPSPRRPQRPKTSR
jgi:RNA-binding protein